MYIDTSTYKFLVRRLSSVVVRAEAFKSLGSTRFDGSIDCFRNVTGSRLSGYQIEDFKLKTSSAEFKRMNTLE